MIQFNNLSRETPYQLFYEKYNEAMSMREKNIQAMAISSYSREREEISSRFVNLKIIDNNNFIFFTNYKSSKANEFLSHNQIAALIYWPSINVQIRIKSNVKKTSKEYNQKYFYKREEKKNALAISSRQSKQIDSYSKVKENYNRVLKVDDLKKCPVYWGGYSFVPYYFEFWEGHQSRINKRDAYEMIDGIWSHSFLQP